MRRLSVSMVCLSLVAVGCGDRNGSLPTAPTASVAPVPPPAPPDPRPAPGQPPTFNHRIEVGDVVQSRVTSDDPVCDPGWPYRCRYFGLTAPSSGLLHITIGWNPQLRDNYPLDMGVFDPQGQVWNATAVQPAHRGVSILATAGATYVIEVWSFLTPDEEFQLKAWMVVP